MVVVFVLVSLWLAWQVLATGLATALSSSQPEVALAIRRDSPEASLALADQALDEGRADAAISNSRQALERSPRLVRAYRIMGLADAQTGRMAEAAALLNIATRWSLRDGPAHQWMFSYDLAQRKYKDALDHADALLRRSTDPAPGLVVAYMSAGEDPSAIAALTDRLAGAPPWRGAFLGRMAQWGSVESTGAVIRGLSQRGQAIPPGELDAYMWRLVGEKRYDDAAQTLRDLGVLRPGRAAGLQDGGFEKAGAPLPFAWRMVDGNGGTIAIEEAPLRPDGKALLIEYDGFSSPELVRQLLILKPGAYRFRGEVYADDAKAADRLAWLLVCADPPSERLALTQTKATAGRWAAFSSVFEVGPECPAQWLILVPQPTDRLQYARVWYDQLSLTAVDRPDRAKQQEQP